MPMQCDAAHRPCSCTSCLMMPMLCCAVGQLWLDVGAGDWLKTVCHVNAKWPCEAYQDAVAMVPDAPEHRCMWRSLPCHTMAHSMRFERIGAKGILKK